jgi:hypothetical protein
MSDGAKSLDDDEFEYVLLDRLSRNFLGEWHTYDEAEATYLEYIADAPTHVDRLELWREDKRIHVDADKIRAVTAA